MAEDKKSFLMYCDWIYTVEKLTDKKAGELLKHILRYVNDHNPTTADPIIDIAFEPIKQQLKRDLKRWEEIRGKRSEAGRKSSQIKKQQTATKSTSVESVEQTATKSTVNANVNVNVNDTVNVIESYMRPRDFLKVNNMVGLHEIQMKSGVNDFESCIEQWSLSVEGGDFKYSENKSDDTRRLTSRLQKWVNTWAQKERNVKTERGKSKSEEIIESNRKVHEMIDAKYGTGKD